MSIDHLAMLRQFVGFNPVIEQFIEDASNVGAERLAGSAWLDKRRQTGVTISGRAFADVHAGDVLHAATWLAAYDQRIEARRVHVDYLANAIAEAPLRGPDMALWSVVLDCDIADEVAKAIDLSDPRPEFLRTGGGRWLREHAKNRDGCRHAGAMSPDLDTDKRERLDAAVDRLVAKARELVSDLTDYPKALAADFIDLTTELDAVADSVETLKRKA